MSLARSAARLITLAFAIAAGAAHAAAKVSTEHQVGVDPHGRPNVSIPIAVPPGSGGMVPSISLAYTGDGSGLAGVGWSMGVAPLATRARFTATGLKTEAGAEAASSAITRCPSTALNDGLMGGIKLDFTDRFCIDGQRLVVHGSGTYGHDQTEYRTEVESFTKAISYGTAGSGPAYFKIWTKAGLILEYGNTADSRIEVPPNSTPRLWALNKVSDRSGNYYTVTYNETVATGEFVIDRIDYTGNAAAGLAPYNSVRFFYETRPDTSVAYYNGLAVQSQKRLISIKTYTEATYVKEYRIAYSLSPDSARSVLTSVRECDPSGICLGALTFGYQGAGMKLEQAGSQTALGDMISPRNVVKLQHGDFNGDGFQDVWVMDDWNQGRVCYGPTFAAAGCATPFGGPPEAIVLDWDGDGLSDIAFFNSEAGVFLICRGPNPTPYVDCYGAPNAAKPYPNFAGYKFIAGDFNGDGRDELFGWNLQDPNQGFAMHCNPLVIIQIPNVQGGSTCNGSVYSGINQNVIKGDFDGDGLTDILYVGAAAYMVCTGRAITGAIGCSYVPAPNWRDNSQIIVGDYNGDGNADLIRLTTTGVESCPGPGFANAINCTTVSAPAGNWRDTYKAQSGDFNGDGAADMLLVANGGTFVCYGPGVQSSITCPVVTYGNWYPFPTAVGDFKGDGSSDIFVGHNNSGTLVSGAVNATDRLYTTSNLAFNVLHSFVHRPLTDSAIYTKGTVPTTLSGVVAAYPLQDTRQPLWVVSQHNRPNGIAGTNATNFKYEKARINLSGRRFLGYEIVKDTDVASGRETVTTRAQIYPHYYRVSDRKVYVNATLVAKSYSLLLNMSSFEGKTFSAVGNSYDASYGLDGSWKSIMVSYGYDTYGNVAGETYALNEYQTGTTRKSISLTFDNDPALWLFGQLRSSTVTHVKGWDQVHQQRGYTPVPGTLLVQQEIRDPDTPAMRLTTDYIRDAVGNATSTTISGTGIVTRTETVAWDTKKRFPLSRTNALNQTTSESFDARFGTRLSLTDPNNLTTTWIVDGFGRTTYETRPGGFWTQWAYETSSTWGHAKHRVVQTNIASTAATASHFDLFGREVAILKRNFADNNWVVDNWRVYDANGKLSRKYLPFEGGASNPPNTLLAYDSLGRLSTETAPNGAVTTYTYSAQPNAGPVTTTATNAKSQVTKHVRDVHGELQQVIDPLNKTTTYEHTPHGKLWRTTDSAGVQMTTTYNQWGWETAKSDPSLGSWTFTHDVLGNLKTEPLRLYRRPPGLSQAAMGS